MYDYAGRCTIFASIFRIGKDIFRIKFVDFDTIARKNQFKGGKCEGARMSARAIFDVALIFTYRCSLNFRLMKVESLCTSAITYYSAHFFGTPSSFCASV
jgi:hypothetical protein